MFSRKTLVMLAAAALVVVAAVLGALTYPGWQGWVFDRQSETSTDEEAHDHEDQHRIAISEQARRNLRLNLDPVILTTYSRKIPVPATVVERPGKSDRGVTAPAAGIVTSVAVTPGQVVHAGDELFTLRVVSEALQTSQTEYYKAALELKITEDQKKRLQKVASQGVIPEVRLLELDYQIDRLNATLKAYAQDLRARGVPEEELPKIREGDFLRHITVRVPARATPSSPALAGTGTSSGQNQQYHTTPPDPPEYKVQELKVTLGEYVQAGQALGYLADHRLLFLEGHAFKEQVGLLARAAQMGWPVSAEFAEETAGLWPRFDQTLKIERIGVTMDPNGLTVPFYMPLVNQELSRDKPPRIWRFRPGQRVLLYVIVEKIPADEEKSPGVFVLPREAVVREGPEAYVFRWVGRNKKGDLLLERQPVHVRLDAGREFVLANDGSISAGDHIARNGAAALNRVLQAQSGGGSDPHAGHSHPH